jgi:NAD+ synthase (glutamine-hydrolysing)
VTTYGSARLPPSQTRVHGSAGASPSQITNETTKLNRIQLAAAALNQTPMAWEENAGHIRTAIDAARSAQAGILCLPELCITGYGCEDMFFSAGVERTAAEVLMELVPETRGMVACLGLPVFHEGALYNAAAVACDGQLLGFVAKQHLAGDGIHYEPRWFRRWPAGNVGSLAVAGKEYPIGDVLFECGGVRIGLEVCRDAWVADRTGAQLAQRGADVILNPSASHFAFAKQQIRERFVLEGSRAFCVSYVYCNLLGNEAGRAIYDGGTLIASGGKMLVRGPRFSFADWVLTSAVIDVTSTRRAKAESFPDVTARRGDEDAGRVEVAFEYPQVDEPTGSVTICTDASGEAGVPGHPQWETGTHQKEEEFTRAEALALFDYLRKSRAQGFVVSLSGGADSTTVTVLVSLMLRFAEHEIGLPAILKKLSHIRSLPDSERKLMARLLTCVYQSTRNSGQETLRAAEKISEAVGAEFLEWNVDKLVDQYAHIVSAATGRDLNWQQDDVALQNIQARARGPGIWLLANLRGALLLTTSNRSEAAVGYATMDGDTCGGLAPIAGIDKAFLLDWLKWMESSGPAEIGPLPALEIVTRLRPTAELRPPAADQTDEADLMPYRVLDAIERAAIRDKQLPIEVFQTVRPQFPQYDAAQMGAWVERFFRLWCRNQWKRERYAPSFHLDDENLDPKTWCRFPILNSGFERELEELREYLRSGKGKG